MRRAQALVIKLVMNTDKNYSVYKITSPEGKLYFGITQEENPERRWKNGSGYKHNKRFWEDICRLGWESFRTEILMGNLSAEEALTVETELILENGTQNPEKGYNIALHGSAGWKLTPRTASRVFRHPTAAVRRGDDRRRTVRSEGHR